MSQSQKFNLLTQEMRKSRNTHEFNSDENPHMTEDTWRSFFVATKAAWKNRIGTGSNSRISKLFKKESQVRTPLRSATGLPAGQPGQSLPYIINVVHVLFIFLYAVINNRHVPSERPLRDLPEVFHVRSSGVVRYVWGKFY